MGQIDRATGLIGNAAIKVPVTAATTAAITLSGLQTVDGVVLVANDRVLVKNQASSVANGIYISDTGSWNRAPDFDGAYDAVTGTIVMVLNGSTNANTYWRLATTGTVTFGTSAITFAAALAGDSAMVTFLPSGTGGVSRTVSSALAAMVRTGDYNTLAQFNTAAAALTETIGVSSVLGSLGNIGAVTFGIGVANTGWYGANAGDIRLVIAGVTFFSFQSTIIYPGSDNAVDIGAVAPNRFKTGYFGTQLVVGGAASAQAAGHVAYGGSTQATIGANGAASALTANPLGYIKIFVAGVSAIIPYYNA